MAAGRTCGCGKVTAERKEHTSGEVQELRVQLLGGSGFLCAEHLLMMADRSRVRRSSGSS